MEEQLAVSNPSNLRGIARWIVYIGMALIPLWFLPFSLDTLEFNKEILLFLVAGLGMVMFLIDMISEGKLRYKHSVIFWAFLALIVAGIVATVSSTNSYASLFGYGSERGFSLLSWISIAFLFFLAIQLTEDRGKIFQLVLTIGAVASLLVATLQSIGLEIFSGSVFGLRSFNTIGSLNSVGFFSAIALSLFMMSWRGASSRSTLIVSIIRYLGIALAMFFLILINWAPLWIVTFVAMASYIAFATFTGQQIRSMKFYAMPMAVVVIGLFIWLTHFSWDTLKSSFPIEVAPTHGVSYGIAKDAIGKKPLGYGLEQFSTGYDELRSESSVNNIFFQARFTDASSEILNIIIEGGIVMTLAFVALIVLFVWTLIQNLGSKFGGNSEISKLWSASLAGLLVFFFYPASLSITILFVGILALGISMSGTSLSERFVNLESRSSYSLVGSGVFVVGLVGFLAGGYFLINQYIANAQIVKASEIDDKDAKIEKLVASINSYPYDLRPYQVIIDTLLTQIADDIKALGSSAPTAEFSERLRNKIGSVVGVSTRMTEVAPSDSNSWLLRGYVYQNLIGLYRDGDKTADQLALDMYNEATLRSPTNALIYVRVGNVYLTRADQAPRGTSADVISGYLDEAEKNYQKAVSLYNNYGQALYNLAAVYDRKGEIPEAIKQFEKLQATNSREPSLQFQLGLLYYRDDQKSKAITSWEKAVESFPDYSNARWYLSLAYEERGDLGKALDEVRKIELLNPENELVKERIALLEAGTRVIPPSTVLDQEPLNNDE